MADEQAEPERVAELARLLARDVDTLDDDELITLITISGELRRSSRERIGRAIAVLYQRDRLSWPEISRLTGIAAMTAHDWARPYLAADHDVELGPRKGRRRDQP